MLDSKALVKSLPVLAIIQYLRVLRLNGARLDFLSNINSRTKVSDIALTWGFLEFGRFANNYRQLFQERPSVTLKTMM